MSYRLKRTRLLHYCKHFLGLNTTQCRFVEWEYHGHQHFPDTWTRLTKISPMTTASEIPLSPKFTHCSSLIPSPKLLKIFHKLIVCPVSYVATILKPFFSISFSILHTIPFSHLYSSRLLISTSMHTYMDHGNLRFQLLTQFPVPWSGSGAYSLCSLVYTLNPCPVHWMKYKLTNVCIL